jgi:hypothetical protein
LVTAERAVVQAEQWAQSILSGADVSAVDLRRLAGELRAAGRTDCVAELLVQVARRALEGSWRPGERAQLAADVLRDHEQFAYARRLLAQVRREGPDDEVLRQQHALCTYKDQGLPAGRRLDRAWRILESGGPLDQSTNAETLAIAGAIAKRRFEVDARREDLEIALVCYRRGFHQEGQQERWYAGLNAAFVADRLAALQDPVLGDAETATALRLEARTIRTAIVDGLVGGDEGWNDATLGEALFGLGRYDAARDSFAAVARGTSERWRQETTLMQLATIAHLHGVADDPGAQRALGALVGGSPGAVQRAWVGKVGVALSGGGFRASLFHIGVLARLAECNLLRRVEVLSCVSGGSIVGAFYYLKLRRLLQEKPDGEITDRDYVCLVRELADQFLDGVRENLRGRLPMDLTDDVRMVLTKYSRTDRAGELFEELFYSRLRDQPAPWRMPDLPVRPAGSGGGFTLRYENWMRQAKVPVLVLNATTLNTGHSWQFTPTWMGEPPSPLDVRMDASRRLRRVDYRDAPAVGDLQGPTLGQGGGRFCLCAWAVPSDHAQALVRRYRRRAGRRRCPRQPGRGEPARAGLHGAAGERREWSAQGRRGPQAGAARGGHPGQQRLDEARAWSAVRRPAQPGAGRDAARCDGRALDAGPAGAPSGLERLPRAVDPGRGRAGRSLRRAVGHRRAGAAGAGAAAHRPRRLLRR